MDAIGQFTFNRLSGMPERMQGIWARSVRAGVNGVSLKYLGYGAEPFTLQSQDFAIDFEDAKNLYYDYQFLTVAGPQPIIYGGQAPEPSHLFQVLAVYPVRIEAIVAGYKGNDPTRYQGLCECTWHLQPIQTAETQMMALA